MQHGSWQNYLAANSTTPAPEVGMGATLIGWTDRCPYTIIRVVSAKRIIIQEDKATRVDANGMSEMQTYTYEPDPNGDTRTVTLRKDGRWKVAGDGRPVLVGHREKYYDYSF